MFMHNILFPSTNPGGACRREFFIEGNVRIDGILPSG